MLIRDRTVHKEGKSGGSKDVCGKRGDDSLARWYVLYNCLNRTLRADRGQGCPTPLNGTHRGNF